MDEEFQGTIRSTNAFGTDPEIKKLCNSIQLSQVRCRAFVAITECLYQGLRGLSEDD